MGFVTVIKEEIKKSQEASSDFLQVSSITHVLIKDPQWEPLQEDKHSAREPLPTRVLSSFPLAPSPYCQPMTQEDHLRRIAAAPHLNCSTRTSCPSIHALCWAAWGKMGAWASPTSLGKVGPTDNQCKHSVAKGLHPCLIFSFLCHMTRRFSFLF